VADWGGGMSASCKPRVQLFADAGNGWPHPDAVSLAHANQLPLLSASGHESASCKKRCSKYPTLTFVLMS